MTRQSSLPLATVALPWLDAIWNLNKKISQAICLLRKVLRISKANSWSKTFVKANWQGVWWLENTTSKERHCFVCYKQLVPPMTGESFGVPSHSVHSSWTEHAALLATQGHTLFKRSTYTAPPGDSEVKYISSKKKKKMNSLWILKGDTSWQQVMWESYLMNTLTAPSSSWITKVNVKLGLLLLRFGICVALRHVTVGSSTCYTKTGGGLQAVRTQQMKLVCGRIILFPVVCGCS